MRNSLTMKCMVCCAALSVAFCVGGLVGSHYEQWRRMHVPDSVALMASSSVKMALAVAERGDLDQATILIRQAIQRAKCDPESFLYIWNGIREIEERFPSLASSVPLRHELLAGLETAMLDVGSTNDFGRLYKLRTLVREATVTEASDVHEESSNESDSTASAARTTIIETSFATSHEGDIATVDPSALMRAGLAGLREGDEHRGAFLIQAALNSQLQQVTAVPSLWNDYKEYLDSLTRTPYDRLARLSSYLESVERANLACRSLREFELVWAVRSQIVTARMDAHANLLQETVNQMKDTRKQLETSSWQDAFELFEKQSDGWGPQLVVVLGEMPQNGQPSDSDAAIHALRDILTGVLDIASTEVKTLRRRAEDVAKTDSTGQTVRRTKAEVGECEKILESAAELGGRLESLDLLSWIQLLSLSLQAERRLVGDREFEERLRSMFVSLEELHRRVARLQQLRYNLWALRSIYGAETSVSWDTVLGEIEVGLLHPTVNALYSMTYDTLIQKETDPSIRTRRVQNILNTEKDLLSAF